MRVPVKFKVSEEQMDVMQSFASQVGLSVEDFCRQAVFYAINHATLRAEQAQKELETNGPHESASTDTKGTLEQRNESTDSAALPDQTEAGVQG